MLLLALPLAALAQEAVGLNPPLPAAASPWAAEILAYALPPQDVRWLTDDAPWRACAVELNISPDGAFTVEPRPAEGCPEGLLLAAVEASRAWRLRAPEGALGTSRLRVAYVMQYSATLGTTTLHAEVDPGLENADLQGAPGLQLVHRAGPREPIEAKLPKSAKKAGLGPTLCALRASVDASGGLVSAAPAQCPEALVADARKRLAKARLDPKTVDGMPYADEVIIGISYTR